MKFVVDFVVVKLWIFLVNDMEDDSMDFIDLDELLDLEDLKKLDLVFLWVVFCGEGKKRKVCKNCICGFVEELEKEKLRE